MNLIFTCGGTGGHINPAIAVANIWKERYPESNILFVGGAGGMEEKLVPAAGYRLETLPASGMARGISFKAIKHNARAIRRVFRSVKECKRIIGEFDADVVIGTGGYASFPMLLAGSMMKVPTCVHESNAMPGLTTRLIADRVDRVLACFPESAKYYRHPEKVEIVGMPVRREFIYTVKEDARKELGLGQRPVIVSAFGSQGARAMNEMITELFRIEQAEGFPFQHIHAAGSFGWRWMPEYVREKGVDWEQADGIIMKEYLYNMPTVMAAADLIISRAGASTLNEIAAAGTPCIIVPSPNVTNNHQEKNANILKQRGAAVVIREADCDGEKLYAQAKALLEDEKRCEKMRSALRSVAVIDSAQRICRIVCDLAKSHKKVK